MENILNLLYLGNYWIHSSNCQFHGHLSSSDWRRDQTMSAEGMARGGTPIGTQSSACPNYKVFKGDFDIKPHLTLANVRHDSLVKFRCRANKQRFSLKPRFHRDQLLPMRSMPLEWCKRWIPISLLPLRPTRLLLYITMTLHATQLAQVHDGYSLQAAKRN